MDTPGNDIYSGTRDMDTLGGRISRAREAAGMSSAQFARRLGVKSATLHAWECDRSEPRANRLTMIAGMLGVSLSWLLYGAGVAPVDDSENGSGFASARSQLQKLRQLHGEYGEAIARLEGELQRLSQAA